MTSVPDLQICKAGVARMRKIWFSRHGESEYNMFAKIGGDSNISPQGQIYAKMLPDLLVDRVPLVLLQANFFMLELLPCSMMLLHATNSCHLVHS